MCSRGDGMGLVVAWRVIYSSTNPNFKMATKTKARTRSRQPMSEMEESKFHQFFLECIQDMYDAEKQATKALPKLAKAATSEELRSAFEQHLTETEGQLKRLEQIFAALGEPAKGKPCKAMKGLVEEAEETIKDTESGSMVRDAALIGAAQKQEHYEIASYGTARTLARLMGHDEVADLLQQTLDEEGNTDKKLTQLAESQINEQASQE